MALPLVAPFTDLLRARAGALGVRLAVTAATVLLLGAAGLLLGAAGLAALAHVVGFPLAAVLFAAVLALLALLAHLVGRAVLLRQSRATLAAQRRAEADLALADALARRARPLLPLAALVAAFVLARRG